jgi:hypothetical protein
MKIGREAAERPYGIFVPVFRRRNPMFFRADVDACGITVDDWERTALLGYSLFLPSVPRRQKTSLERCDTFRPRAAYFSNLLNGIASPMGQPKTPGTMLQRGYTHTNVNVVLAAGTYP